jgi:filamentous hemagglutinin family protein
MIRHHPRPISGRQFYLATAMTALFAWSGPADALPAGGVIPTGGGTATFDNSILNSLTVNQTSNRVVINWGSFNIGGSEHVTFAQPTKASIAFNVVPASAGVTTIAGSLTANGGVWLFSPAGIIFGAGATVTTGSFLASTGIFNEDAASLNQALNANTIQISPQGTPGQGSITVQPGGCATQPAEIDANAGFVMLHSPTITQDGSVTASDAVVYNADEAVTVQFLPATDNSNIALVNEFSPSGTPSASHIDHNGSTTAGTWFEADAAEDVTTEPGYGGIINLGGVVVAHGMKSDPGNPNDSGAGYSVILDGDSAGDTSGTEVTTIDGSAGTITAASGIEANAGTIKTGLWTSTGGEVNVTGGDTGGVQIDQALVSSGAGPVLIGGAASLAINADVTGAQSVLIGSGGSIQIAPNVKIQAGSTVAGSSLTILSASSLVADPTSTLLVGPSLGAPNGALNISVGGTIAPQAVPEFNLNQAILGQGGSLSLGTAAAGSITLQAVGVNGVGGTINIPGSVSAPGAINIDPNGPVNVNGQLSSGTSVFIAADQVNLGPDGSISAGPGGSEGGGTISTSSGTATVTLQNYATAGDTPVPPGTAGGNILIGAPLIWATDNSGTLTLNAYNSLIVSAPITASDPTAQVSLNTGLGVPGGDYSFVNGGSLSFVGDAYSGQGLAINNQSYQLIFNQADLLNVSTNNSNAFYALATPLDFASGTTATVFTGAPIASTVYTPFTGTFTGLGNTISNLNIQEVTPVGQSTPNGNGGTNGALGLFGFVGSGGVVRDVNLSNASVTGGDGIQAGALVGNLDGTVMNASSSGQVTVGDNGSTNNGADYSDSANAYAGGLVGFSDGQIVNGHSSAIVSGGTSSTAGGLVGQVVNGGSIANSSASGAVTVAGGNPVAGGLVGAVLYSVAITGSSASGLVSGGDDSIVGGLAGELEFGSSATGSFATGATNAGANSQIGGFAGLVDVSTIGASYATGAVTQTAGGGSGFTDTAGGFVGSLLAGTITQSYSSGAVQTVGGADATAYTFAGGFVGDADFNSTVSNAYSLGAVTSTGAFADTGGFAGVVQGGSGIDHVYATGHVTGAGLNAGLVAVLGNPNDLNDMTGSLSDSYWDQGTTGQSVGYHITPTVPPGGPSGTETSVSAIGGLGGANPYATATYTTNFGADLTSGAGMWVMIPGETRPMLSSEYSTTITNAHQLQLMELNLGASYILANNIDASETTSAAGVWNPANGFVPVGGNREANFTGVFDGQGYTIRNLSITFTTADPQSPIPSLTTDGVVGLFGFVDTTGVLENVNLANAHVTGGDGMVVGALAGGVIGSIINATSSGVVIVGNEISTPSSGITAAAGGLVGGSAGSISNSSSSASVTGGDAFAGGLLGTAGGNSMITNSFATGDVVVGSYPVGGYDSPTAGGLVGELGDDTSQSTPLAVSGSFASGSVTGGAGSNIGGLIGQLNGEVTTSYATGAVIQTAGGVAGSSSNAGGLIGSINDNSLVTQSYASGDVSSVATSTANTFTHAGGFTGDMSNSTASQDYALGAVTITGAAGAGVNRAGGFAGAVYNQASVDHVYATGLVTASNPSGIVTGGLVAQVGSNNGGGDTSGGSVTDSYWDQGTTNQTVGANIETPTGGVVTNVNPVGAGSPNGAYATASYANFDFTNVWYMVPGSTRPILRSEYSTDITNAHQLQLMDLHLNANYTLGNDIDATNTDGASGIWNPATGFSPVGATVTPGFTGTFDGQGHTITNLTIIETTQNPQSLQYVDQETDGAVGLFGFVGSAGTLQNVNLANVNVTGGNGMEVGALAGDMAGTVVNASSSGHVTVGALDSEEGSDARGGGLIGELEGTLQTSSSSATVTGGSGALVGGLVGEAMGPSADVNAVATGSFATGNVVGGAGSTAGGFVGFGSDFTVSYSYATGSVTQTSAADNWAGGFAGGLEFSTVNSSFATGAVSTVGTTNNPALAGGFVGNLLATTVTDAYSSSSVTGGGPDDVVGGFAGSVGLDSVVTNVLATGAVSGPTEGGLVGGLFGLVTNASQPDDEEGENPSITNAYWNSSPSSTGQSSPYNLNAVGSATINNVADVSDDPYDPASYTGFNFGAVPGVAPVWSIPSAGNYPQLYGASHVLNITAEDTTSQYGNYPVYMLSVTGLQGGDTISSAVQGYQVQALDAPTSSTSGYYNVNDNPAADLNFTYDLSVSNISATGAGPALTGVYRPIYNDNANIFDGGLTVTPQQVTLSASGDRRNYDGDVDSGAGGNVSGTVVPGDSVYATEQFDDPNAGSRTLSITGVNVIDGNEGANYVVTVDPTPADGQIDAEPIVISAASGAKEYDGGTTSSGTPFLASGQFYGSDGVTDLTQSFVSKDVLGLNGSTLVVNGGYTLSLADSADYDITTATAHGTITPASLLLDATGESRGYDGTTSSTALPTIDSSTPLLNVNDTVTGLTQAFESKDVLGANRSTLNVTGYSVNDGDGGADYTVSLAPASGTITPASLLIDATSESRAYDGTTSSTALPTVDSSTPLLNINDTVTGLTQAFARKDVLGANLSTLNVTGYSVNDGDGGADYTVSLAPADGTITPVNITLSATSETKVYDGTTNSDKAPTASQLFEGDSLVATQSYTSKDVLGTDESILAINEGYSINDGNGGADYNITNVYTAAGTITPASLLLDATGESRVYDGTTSSTALPTIDSSTPLLNVNDTVTGLTQAFESKDVLGANRSTLNVTGYSVNDGDGGADYTVSLAPASGTITPASLLIDATSESRAYDGTTSSTALPTVDSSTPLLNINDTVTGLTQAFARKDVLGANLSTLNVTGYSVNDGDGGADYTVSLAPADGTITPVNITLSATSETKVYDGTTNSDKAPTASQLFEGDSLVATQSYTSKDVLGTDESILAINEGYSINDGNGGADYNITNVYTAAGTITPLALTASLTGPVQKVYDGTIGATLTGSNYSLPGVIQGDTVVLNDPTSGTYDTRNAGTGKTVTVTGLRISGGDAEDYSLSSTTAADPVGVITPAPLTLAAVTDTKTYDGGVTSTGTPTNSALVEGDSLSGLAQSFDSRNAGARTLLVTGYTIDDGNDGHNYAVTLVSAPGTINPAPLTIGAVADAKTYDGTTASGATPTYSTLFGGDTITGLTETYDSKDAGARTLSVGGYTVNDGNDGGNYVVTTTTAAGEIDPKALTAVLIGNVQKAYDGNTAATLASSNYSLPGVIGTDDVSLNDPTNGAYADPSAGTHKTVTVGGLVLSGADAANYTVNGSAAGPVGTITAPPQTLQIVVPTQDVTTPGFVQTATDAAGAVQNAITNTTTVVNVFPVGNDNNNAAQGDNLPITGAGNRDLWTSSEDSDQACAPGAPTPCPPNGGSH